MRTTLLEHAVPLAGDDTLAQRLGGLGKPVQDDEAAIRVGVEGPQGGVYRIIETTSVVEAVHVFEALADLGLRAEQGRKEHGVALTRVFRARR